MRCRSYIHCYACGGRIRELADDVVLARKDGSEVRFYHVGRCGLRARRTWVAEPGAWRYTRRPALDEGVEEEVA